MSESEIIAWIAVGWCYFWGALVSFVLAYISRTPNPTINSMLVLVSFSWPVTMPWILINTFAELGKDGK